MIKSISDKIGTSGQDISGIYSDGNCKLEGNISHKICCLTNMRTARGYSFVRGCMAAIVMVILPFCASTVSYGQITDSLSHYLGIAALNNPAVKSAFLTYEASLQKIPQIRALEDPKVDIGFFLNPMNTFGGKQLGQIQIMQIFPWFGTKKAAATEVEHMAKMAFERFREERDNIYYQVFSQWFLICSLQQRLFNNVENRKLLTQLEELAIRRFSSGGTAPASVRDNPSSTTSSSIGSGGNISNMGSMGMASMGSMNTTGSGGSSSSSSMGGMNMGGSGSMGMGGSSGMVDVLRIQIEMAELDNNIESISSEIEAEKVRFNTLLNRPLTCGVDIPDSICVIPFDFDMEEIMETVRWQNPMLSMYSEEALAHEAMAEMNRRMGYPMFGIGIQYMLVGKSSNSMVMPDMNGNDMVMPMLSVSIPIFRKKYNSAQRESMMLKQASEESYINTLNSLEAELHLLQHRLDDALRKTELYGKQVALTQTTYELILSEFVAGKADLSSAIQVQRQLLDYKLKEAVAITEYNTMLAAIWKVMSVQ